MKKSKLLSFLLALSLSAAAFTGLTGCGEEETQDDNMVIYGYEEGKSEYVMENEHLKFVMDPTTTQFSLTEKASGKVWYSNPPDLSEETIANKSTKDLLQSTLTLVYGTKNGVETTLNNYGYSVSNGLYEIEEVENGIKVKYSIGNIERTYLVPAALPEERYLSFYNQMESKTQKRLDQYYRKYDLNNLRAEDDKDKLLETYPDLATEPVYVLRDGLQEHIRVRIEEYFGGAGYTYEDYVQDSEKYSTTKVTDKPAYDVSVIYELDGKDFVVRVPLEEVDYKDTYPIISIRPLPYFGAGGSTDDGFILVPDGNGAVICFNNGRQTQSSFYSNMYGWDYGQQRDAVITETRSLFPVFGICNNGSSFLCIAEEGSAYTTIEADVSGRLHTFNYANTSYKIVHSASMDVSSKSDKAVVVYEKNVPQGDLVSRYRFVSGDTYVDMAVAYRDYLTARYAQLDKNNDAQTPLIVELVGAIEAVENHMGFPVTVSRELTSYKEAAKILDDFLAAGVKNLDMKYIGWFNDSVHHKVPTKVKLISELGSKKEFKNFVSKANEAGVDLYLEAFVEFVYKNSLTDGFKINRDSAKYVTKEIAELWDYNPVIYALEDDEDDTLRYFVKNKYTNKLIDSLVKAAEKYGAKNLSFADLGKLLGGDYNPKAVVTREETMKLQQEKLAQLKESGNGVMVYTGNEYVIPYVDAVLDLDLTGKRYGIEDYSVPFYTIALHGLVNYTGIAMNLAPDREQTWLKSIETGAGLYFTFIDSPGSAVWETEYTYLHGSEYSMWKDEALAMYQEYNAALGHVYNQFITGHRYLADGVTETTYEDGTKVYVNYNYTDYSADGVSVLARNYAVKKGGE